MKRMHDRLNIGKIILLPEPKKVDEEPPSVTEPGITDAASEKRDQVQVEEF